MNEMAGHPIRSVRLDGPPAFVVRRAHDGGAEAFDRANLRIGRRVHHHHRAARADFPCGEGDALSRVAGAHGPHAFLQLLRCQLADDVVGAADFEGADRLQRLELQVEIRFELDERGADRGVIDGRRRIADCGQRNLTARHRGGQDVGIVPAEPTSVNGRPASAVSSRVNSWQLQSSAGPVGSCSLSLRLRLRIARR